MNVITKITILSSLIVICGCSSVVKRGTTSEQGNRKKSSEKIIANAYLFDSRLKIHNKPRSFRLEVYETDSVIALAGRGYLGKGVLKGWIRHDSLKVYFPATDEYVYDATPQLLSSENCLENINEFDLLKLFQGEIEQVFNDQLFNVIADIGKSKYNYTVIADNCLWKIDLKYDIKDNQKRLKSFLITNSNSLEIKGQRRTIKQNAKVPYSKFQVDIPERALIINP